MATTIKSTGLDFETIKNNLKTHLVESGEFTDYNFEASGLSSLLDVLAYNTHYNALTANFALNESFLSTAQLRSSMVGLATALGYSPASKVASSILVKLSITDTSAPSEIVLPIGTRFTTSVNDRSFTFATREVYFGRPIGGNVYEFETSTGSKNIPIYEGTLKSKTFYASGTVGEDTFVLQDNSLDLNNVKVKVYETATSTVPTLYSDINNSSALTEDSTIYILREAPNGFYELTFSNGTNLGRAPVAGNRIVVEYSRVSGSAANGARVFTPSDTPVVGETLTVVTEGRQSSGGLQKESIESIRKNAPFLYAAQNRMVTAEDYASLTQRNFNSYIENVKAWGGEDNIPPEYGKVFMSIDFFDGFSTVTKDQVKTDIRDLASNLSVASFDISFVEPVVTYLEIDSFFQWNPTLTSTTKSGIEQTVADTVNNTLNASLGTFNQSFRRSNLLSAIDNVDPSVLNSRIDLKMQYRVGPAYEDDRFINLSTIQKDYTLTYPTALQSPQSDSFTIVSSTFQDTSTSFVVFLRNKLGSNIIEMVTLGGGVINYNAGSYDATQGTITLNNFGKLTAANNEIRITAIPANSSTISPQRNSILEYDRLNSSTTALITDTV